jgi:hypothetical protein
VKLVATGLPDHHDGSAIGPSVFRRVGVDVQPEFGHGVDDGIEGHLPRFGLQHADAVVEILVGARPAAIDARQQRPAARQGDTGRERHQGNEIAAIEGQRLNFRLADVVVHRPVGGFEQRRCRIHLHRLRRLSPLPASHSAGPGRRCAARCPPAGRAEANFLYRQHILSGGQPEQVVLATLVSRSFD